MVANSPRVVVGLPLSRRVVLSVADVMCLGLRNRKQSNIWWSLRGSKARLVSNGVAVLHGRMSGILCRCILAMLDGEMESTLVRVVEGAGLGCLEGVISNRAGLGSLVRG